MASALSKILQNYRYAAKTEREKGTYFEELFACYLKHEPRYRDLYTNVWSYAEWARAQGISAKDDGIDLVAERRLRKLEIASFGTQTCGPVMTSR